MKLCECGCGQEAPRAVKRDKKRGLEKGEYARFVYRHQNRNRPIHGPSLNFEEDENGCWIWKGALKSSGYGNVRVTVSRGQAKTVDAHRFMYERSYGPVPEGMHLHHRCGMRACVNPEHLEVASQLEHNRSHAKLTMESAREIRALAATGASLAQLGRRFGVARRTIHDVLRGYTWREDPLEEALAISYGGSE